MAEETENRRTDLLCVFVHGFKGTDSTFDGFPERLQNMVAGPGTGVETVSCVVFPAYESAATEKFADWLTTTVVHKEVANGQGGGAGKTKVVLCGHSMGGLLIADAMLAIAASRLQKTAPLWPHIIACIAYDTPYYGLHPFIFKNQTTKVVAYAQQAQKLASGLGLFGAATESTSAASSVSSAQPRALLTATDTTAAASKPSTSSIWNKWAPAAIGAVAAGAAAGAAWYKKEDLTTSVTWASDHLKYVGNLWDQKGLHTRVESLIAVQKESGVYFHNFYTLLPKKSALEEPRTFINLPSKSSEAFQYHSAVQNTLAEDEIAAHIAMFSPKTNDGYYDLGLQTADIIRRALEEANQIEARDALATMKNIDLGASHEEKEEDLLS
ncbi:hypothetical protein DL93DRAFT_2149723 [Clavulina sp. PMI_390]|nr:hypothetical protein DL93DRAFT_2149723 [Clavulina sp. PMI_390]